MQIVNKGAEAKLVETLSVLSPQPEGWAVVYFAFEQLLEEYRNEYQIKIAINMIADLVRNHEATAFVCGDSAIFLLCKKSETLHVNKIIFQLRYLFMDDPLAYDVNGEENPRFCTYYDLNESFDKLATLARSRMLNEGRGGAAPKLVAKNPPKVATAPADANASSSIEQVRRQFAMQDRPAAKTLNAVSLANVERDLRNADISQSVRRQPICAAINDMMVRRVFDEFYINIPHLRQVLRVDSDLLANRWLFRYITELLDERVLHLIQHNPTRYLDLPLSLNLNVRTLLSDAFAQFDAFIKPSVKVSIVLEIQIADVFDDMRAFQLARQSMQRLGYRICLDGVSDLSFTQIDREKLGFDLVKLQWNADMPSDLQNEHNKAIAESVRRCGPNRVILCRCDSRKAVDYGQALGISLFQGRYLDKLTNPLAKVEN